jgi:hypothetical protein
MGKRGPEPTRRYRKRILVPRRLLVETNHQLLTAQHFNERLEKFLMNFDEGRYPVSGLEPALIEQMVEAVEMVQSAVIEGIEWFYVRTEGPNAVPESGQPHAVPAGGMADNDGEW